ncbi:MAG: hypothetical protein RLZZ144_24 [Pseudomonadota bacterium]|jgi:hypothetical protein
MLYTAIKVAVSAIVIVAITEIAKRSSGLAALIAALPLTSLLAFMWMHFEGSDSLAIADLSSQIFWLVLPSLLLFLLLPVLLKQGMNFWLSLMISMAVTAVCYVFMLPFLRQFGVRL